MTETSQPCKVSILPQFGFVSNFEIRISDLADGSDNMLVGMNQ